MKPLTTSWLIVSMLYFLEIIFFSIILCNGLLRSGITSYQDLQYDEAGVYAGALLFIIFFCLVFGVLSLKKWSTRKKGSNDVGIKGWKISILSFFLFGFLVGNLLLFASRYSNFDPWFIVLIIPFIIILFLDIVIIFLSIKLHRKEVLESH